ncbi:sodium:proton antiporter, partial [Litoreibacter sp.]|nr:sodium:proton antiporter [Litoreibacter sp.]
MDLLQIASLLIVLAAVFGALNYWFLKLPSSIGILIVALIASLSVMAADMFWPTLGMADQVRAVVG